MNNQLPADLEQLDYAEVQGNWFKFSDNAVTAAGRLRYLPRPFRQLSAVTLDVQPLLQPARFCGIERRGQRLAVVDASQRNR
jgi:hypothetical protein